MSERRLVYYAFDLSPHTVEQVRNSVASIRKHNERIRIQACVLGRIDDDLARFFAEHSVIHTNLPATALGKPRTMATFLKWSSLGYLESAEEVLYLDSDTYCFQDIELVFERESNDYDFLARTYPRDPERWTKFGVWLMEPEWPPFRAYRERLARSLDVPLYERINSGIMLFRRGAHRRLAERIDLLWRAAACFNRFTIPLAMEGPHVRSLWLWEELSAELFLPLAGVRSVGPLSREVCPFYSEYLGRDVDSLGVVTHTNQAHYLHLLFGLSREAFEDYRRRIPVGPLNSMRRSRLKALRIACLTLAHYLDFKYQPLLAWRLGRARRRLVGHRASADGAMGPRSNAP